MGRGEYTGNPKCFQQNTKAKTPSRKIRIKMGISCEQMSHRRKEGRTEEAVIEKEDLQQDRAKKGSLVTD